VVVVLSEVLGFILSVALLGLSGRYATMSASRLMNLARSRWGVGRLTARMATCTELKSRNCGLGRTHSKRSQCSCLRALRAQYTRCPCVLGWICRFVMHRTSSARPDRVWP